MWLGLYPVFSGHSARKIGGNWLRGVMAIPFSVWEQRRWTGKSRKLERGRSTVTCTSANVNRYYSTELTDVTLSFPFWWTHEKGNCEALQGNAQLALWCLIYMLILFKESTTMRGLAGRGISKSTFMQIWTLTWPVTSCGKYDMFSNPIANEAKYNL